MFNRNQMFKNLIMLLDSLEFDGASQKEISDYLLVFHLENKEVAYLIGFILV